MRLLVLKPDHLGDFVLALPSLWEAQLFLKQQSATPEIDLLCAPANAIWTKILPWLGSAFVLIHPRYQRPSPSYSHRLKLHLQAIRAGLKLRQRQYDYAVDLTNTPNDLLAKLVLIASGARRRYGGKGAYSFLLHQAFEAPKERCHVTEILAARFPTTWGVSGKTPPEVWMPEILRYQSELTAPRMLISPWAGTPAKRWPVSHWREFLNMPLPLERILIAPLEKVAEAHLLAEGSHTRVFEVRSIRETLELLAHSRLAIAMDSATAHFAWLTGTPLIQLFAGTTELERWRSLAPHATYLNAFPYCAPCHLEICNQPRHFCMENISPQRLMEAVEEKLQR